MNQHDPQPRTIPVVIIGAGPVGLSLALGLANLGVRSVLLERKPSTSEHSKAPALHVRTREILRGWGVEHALREAGTLLETMPVFTATGRRRLEFDFTGLAEEAEQPGILFLEQGTTERLLLQALLATGRCEVYFDTEATAVEPGEYTTAVTYYTQGQSRMLHAEFSVGCDGARSMVRTALGLAFEGATLPVRATLADVRVQDERDALPWPRNNNGPRGITSAMRLSPQLWRLIRVERGETVPGDSVPGDSVPGETVPAEEVATWVREVLGSGPAPVVWASRFQFQQRSSPRYRVGRVLLAGDAAHVFPPVMGQGMNAGIQDANNLAWKLAAALDGGDTERLLASYDTERRHAVGTVSAYVERRARLGISAPRVVRAGLLAVMRATMAIPVARRRSLRSLAMLDRGYAASALLEANDRCAGMRLPDPVLLGPKGQQVRLHDALPPGAVLLRIDREAPSGTETATFPDVAEMACLRIGPGGYRDPAGLLREVLGSREGWILVRPDRHVAWTRTEVEGLHEAVRRALGRVRG